MKTCQLSFSREQEEFCTYETKITETVLERMRGLLKSPPLAMKSALLITPCNSVHSFFMRYAIDVIYVDKNHAVMKLVSRLSTWRASAHFSASYVVELSAGEIERQGIKVGDHCTCKNL